MHNDLTRITRITSTKMELKLIEKQFIFARRCVCEGGIEILNQSYTKILFKILS